MRLLISALTALILFATPVVAGDRADADAAYKAGDYQKAYRLLKPLAEQGNTQAQSNLGLMYANGEGVPENDAKAVHWYRKAAKQGDAHAQNNLGLMYDYGQGVPEDDAKAVHWFRKAAEQGHAEAQNNLGVMYYSGEGVPEDYVQAYAWTSIAAAQGLKDAKKNKDIAKKQMTPAQITKGQALAAEYWDKYVVPFQKD